MPSPTPPGVDRRGRCAGLIGPRETCSGWRRWRCRTV